jgi:Cell wall-active antibiotics response 4TMS YvqF
LEIKPRGILSILSAADRSGDWELPERIWVRTIMGRVRLDLRHARFQPGTSEIAITAIMAEVRITLPHGVRVECDDFKVKRVSKAVPRPDAPCVRIYGTGYAGDVKVRVVDPNQQ